MLGLRVCEILYMTFKSEISVSSGSSALPNISLSGFLSQIFWGLVGVCGERGAGVGGRVGGDDIFPVQYLPLGSPIWGPASHCLRMTSTVVIFLPFLGH